MKGGYRSVIIATFVVLSALFTLSTATATNTTTTPLTDLTPHPHFILSHVNDDVIAISDIPPGAKVLVLGSDGVVGRAMVKQLKLAGYQVEEVKNRRHIDLRIPGALDRFSEISFVMFLACEVGGAKYIHESTGSTQLDIIANNMKIYDTVFEYITRHRLPFIFTSTSLVLEPDAYGSMKRLGESWVKALKLGKIVRLWNVYNAEAIGLKSHVVSDWSHACATKGKVKALTNGAERRQFVHADDCALALIALMEHYNEAEFISDIASLDWISIRDISTTINQYLESQSLPLCEFEFPSRPGATRANIEPRADQKLFQWWTPLVSLLDGVGGIVDYYRQEHQQQQQQSGAQPTKDDL